MAQWWGRLGLELRLSILIQGMLIVALVSAQQWVTARFRQEIISAAENRAKIVADGAINGLNTLMITKAGKDDEVISNKKSRMLFIKNMGASENIKEMRVFRVKQMDSEFPEPLPEEVPVDEVDRRVLDSGVAEAALVRTSDGGTGLRAVVPYIAKKNFRGIDCLQCHGVDEGTVLGAASVTIDIDGDIATIDNASIKMWIGQAILQVVLFLAVNLVVRRLLSQLGGEPKHVIDIVRRFAKGDLSCEIATRKGDSSSLLASVKDMQQGLRALIGSTLHAADSLMRSAEELVGSAHKVQAASQRQSDLSSSVASSVEEMTVCIGQISDNAATATAHASEAGSLAQEGSGVVENVTLEMNRISDVVTDSAQVVGSLGEKSHQISGIATAIKEIANQTNLLALNAAIEAARAGEQGRGFAVVADEVRELADRTSLSTQEITAMIQVISGGTDDAVRGMTQGNARVREGVEMVRLAGSAMDKIQLGAKKVLQSVADISASLKEQTATSNQIAREVEGIARMTAETSVIVEDVAGSADQLKDLAADLKQRVGQFHL